MMVNRGMFRLQVLNMQAQADTKRRRQPKDDKGDEKMEPADEGWLDQAVWPPGVGGQSAWGRADTCWRHEHGWRRMQPFMHIKDRNHSAG